MKKITEETSRAFYTQKLPGFSLGNSKVKTSINQSETYTEYRLFWNLIAEIRDYHVYRYKRLRLNNCNYYTQTTKERLNWILWQFGLWQIIQRKWTWYYVNPAWEETLFTWRLEFEYDWIWDQQRKPFIPKEEQPWL